MKKEFFTLNEACELLGKSRRTITRYIKKGLLNPEKVKTEKGVLEYRFNRSELESLKKPDTIGQTTGQNIKIEKNDDDTLALLNDTMKLLQKQLKTKDTQIKQLLERQRETNYLLKGLQDKVLMLEDKSKDTKHRTDDRTNDTPNAIKRFFGRWFKSGDNYR